MHIAVWVVKQQLAPWRHRQRFDFFVLARNTWHVRTYTSERFALRLHLGDERSVSDRRRPAVASSPALSTVCKQTSAMHSTRGIVVDRPSAKIYKSNVPRARHRARRRTSARFGAGTTVVHGGAGPSTGPSFSSHDKSHRPGPWFFNYLINKTIIAASCVDEATTPDRPWSLNVVCPTSVDSVWVYASFFIIIVIIIIYFAPE